MSQEWTVDFCYQKLEENAEIILGARESNEATTRLRAINTVLFDVLGWDKLCVEAERHCRDEGYADYVFSQNEAICLVLEAKKSGISFVLPKRRYQSTPVGFALLGRECPEANTAMTQAVGYAAALGSRYVAISNGHQWFLALSFVSQQQIAQRLVYVFESLEAIRDRFQDFWRCFGPTGVFSNAPADELLESRKAPAPARLSTHIPNYPAPADRNVIANELSYILGLVWDEMGQQEDEEQFLRACYVQPEPSRDAIAFTKELFEKRRQTDQLAAEEVSDLSKVPDLIKYYTPERPIVVLGGIGHGKSIFLRYLRLLEAKEHLEAYIQIDVDFLDRPDTRSQVAAYVYSEIDRQLQQVYDIDIREDRFVRGVLHLELQRFRKTPRGQLYDGDPDTYKLRELERIESITRDNHSYLTHAFRHLKKGRKCSVALFLDNLDRRDDGIQEEAFLRASAMARDWACLVFICLRPGTFHKSLGDGVLDSVAPRTIRVVPPATTPLLRKRFRYSASLAQGIPREDLRRAPRPPLRREVVLDLPSVASFLTCCEQSVRRRRDLVALFDAVSNANVRDLLRYTKQIITCQHLNTKKILENIPGGYLMPVHEALRALLYGDSMHYDPNQSPFVNLFDLARADPMEHFSRFVALHYLNRLSPASRTGGFCATQDLVDYLCQLGYSGQHARDTVSFLQEKNCCSARLPGTSALDPGSSVRATTLGRYHVNELVGRFQYVDAIVVDTPILDEATRDKVVDAAHIVERLDRAKLFIDYLDDCSQHVQDADALRLWRDAHTTLSQDICGIRSGLAEERARGRESRRTDRK